MAKTSKGGNRSQFIICTSKAEWLDPKKVIFSEMVEGFDVLKAIDKIASITGTTSKVVMVIDSRIKKVQSGREVGGQHVRAYQDNRTVYVIIVDKLNYLYATSLKKLKTFPLLM
ncbi:hypothetical protein Ddye_016293 [Dipteronia dyeriana]|uniref:Peptidyl-prolyl cis-trans isomerase n=1 Tax=Dipteronia dyeriana TaxID=168575 RepID=A0AAD9U6Z3_9ROSI|nr:hypothetical protein Ddye_016293 [Dipteronia dyeriana]